MKKSRQKISNQIDNLLDILRERVDNKVEKEIQDTLNDWQKRYPRHTFQAYQAHGMLSVEIFPQIGKAGHPSHHPEVNFYDRIPADFKRGAIKTLIDEIEELIDWHCSLEYTVSTSDTNRMFSK